jgi:hypothetical protein
MYDHKAEDKLPVYCVPKILTLDDLKQLMQITEKHLP